MTTHKLFLLSLGCSKNTVDSERLIAQAEASGIIFTDTADEADTILINTCGFIEDAKEESIAETLAAIEKKSEGKIKRVYVMGCLTELYRRELHEEMAEVDGFFGTRELPEILAALGAEYREELYDRRSLLTPPLRLSQDCRRVQPRLLVLLNSDHQGALPQPTHRAAPARSGPAESRRCEGTERYCTGYQHVRLRHGGQINAERPGTPPLRHGI